MITTIVYYQGKEAFRCERMQLDDNRPRWSGEPEHLVEMAVCMQQDAYNTGGPQEVHDAYDWCCSANGDLGFYGPDNEKGPWSMKVEGWKPGDGTESAQLRPPDENVVY